MRTLAQLRTKLAELGPDGRALLGDVAKLEREFERRGSRVAAMASASRLARTLQSAGGGPRYALEAVLMALTALSGAERSLILRPDPEAASGYAAVATWPRGANGSHVQGDLVRAVIASGAPHHQGGTARRDRHGLLVIGFRRAMAVPVSRREADPVCVYLDGLVHQGPFDEVDLEVLSAFVSGVRQIMVESVSELAGGVVP